MARVNVRQQRLQSTYFKWGMLRSIPKAAIVHQSVFLVLHLLASFLNIRVPWCLSLLVSVHIHYTYLNALFVLTGPLLAGSPEADLNKRDSLSYMAPWRFSALKETAKGVAAVYSLLLYFLALYALFEIALLMPISFFIFRGCSFLVAFSHLMYSKLVSYYDHDRYLEYLASGRCVEKLEYYLYVYSLSVRETVFLYGCFIILSLLCVCPIYRIYLERGGFLLPRYFVERQGMILLFSRPRCNEKPLQDWKIVNLVIYAIILGGYLSFYMVRYYWLIDYFIDESLEVDHDYSHEVYAVLKTRVSIGSEMRMMLSWLATLTLLTTWEYLKLMVYTSYVTEVRSLTVDVKRLDTALAISGRMLREQNARPQAVDQTKISF